jgi:hypothetical protein
MQERINLKIAFNTSKGRALDIIKNAKTEANTQNPSNTLVLRVKELLKSLQDHGNVLKPVGSGYQTSPESTSRQYNLRNQNQEGIRSESRIQSNFTTIIHRSSRVVFAMVLTPYEIARNSCQCPYRSD